MTIEKFWEREHVRVLLLESRGEDERPEEVPVIVKGVTEDGVRVTVEPVDGSAPPKAVSPISLSVLKSDEHSRARERMSWLLACERLGGLSRADGEQLFARLTMRGPRAGRESGVER